MRFLNGKRTIIRKNNRQGGQYSGRTFVGEDICPRWFFSSNCGIWDIFGMVDVYILILSTYEQPLILNLKWLKSGYRTSITFPLALTHKKINMYSKKQFPTPHTQSGALPPDWLMTSRASLLIGCWELTQCGGKYWSELSASTSLMSYGDARQT